MHEKYITLKNHLAEIQDLGKASGLLGWDQRTMMPTKASSLRSEQMATLAKVIHQMFTSPEVGHLLEELRPYEQSLPFDSDEASLIRVARRDFEKATRVPTELRMALARAGSKGTQVWIQARKESNFAMFLPALEEVIELKRRYIECFPRIEDDPAASVYDPLLDDFEPGMKTQTVRAIFDELKRDLVPLIRALSARAGEVDDAVLHGHFPQEQQRSFVISILERFGFNPDTFRLDPTVHPFASSLGTTDIRLTTRYNEDFINACLFGSMHECGHGLYENGVSPALERTLLCRGASSATHKSQSRMWENLVGRSRPFWSFFYPRLQTAFPEQFGRVKMETFYRAINKVQPSFIRVEADEVTYGIHIILRFELEQEVFEGRLAPKDLPEAWRSRFKEYLGLEIPNDAQGVLQDIHWSSGMFGYFPTYQLGNIVASQLWEAALADMPGLYDQFARGEFTPLREWLRAHLHQYGRKYTPLETLGKALGQDGAAAIQVAPYLRYLKAKFGDIYSL